MHIYFSGIGGVGIGPLALVTKQAGYEVSGSDKQDSSYITYLRQRGITDITIGQNYDDVAKIHADKPIDWLVYTSALPLENPNAPELQFCRENNIRTSKRDELLTQILSDKSLELIAIAGTHGKTTTTALTVWLLKQLGIPIGYILPAKSSFADMGALEPDARYFVYECDEYDRNFLAYHPKLSLVTGIDWDHPDIYPTRDDYNSAFRQFIGQSQQTYLWQEDAAQLDVADSEMVSVINFQDYPEISLPGEVNRRNAALVMQGMMSLFGKEGTELQKIIEAFPGVSRRFEQIVPGLYTDYAHTPPKIRGALQLGHEVADDNLVVVYEGLHNTRQHFIKDELTTLFDNVKQLYVVPSYLAREDESLELLTPDKLVTLLGEETRHKATGAQLDTSLRQAIQKHIESGDTVLCLSAGGGGSLDEWLRKTFTPQQ